MSDGTVWITDNFKLQREEKYLAKLCNWSSKIAYCHLLVLFWRPKTPEVFLELATLFANSAKFFTTSPISHAWFTSGVSGSSFACAQAVLSHTALLHICHVCFKSPVTYIPVKASTQHQETAEEAKIKHKIKCKVKYKMQTPQTLWINPQPTVLLPSGIRRWLF